MFRIVLIVLLSVAASSQAKHLRAAGVRLGPNPSLCLRVTKSAMETMTNGISIATAKFGMKVPVPDCNVSLSGVNLRVKNARLHRLERPIIRATPHDNNLLAMQLVFPQVEFGGLYDADKPTIFKKLLDDGGLNFTANEVSMYVNLTVDNMENGAPCFKGVSCEAKLGPANLNVKSKKDEKFVADLFRVLMPVVRPVYQTQLCAIINKIIIKKANYILAAMPNVVDVTENFGVKLQVRPRVTKDYVEACLFSKLITDEICQENPAPFVECQTTTPMLAVQVSPTFINEFLCQGFKNNLLTVILNKERLAFLYPLISLGCAEGGKCLGNLVPKLREDYGADADVEVITKFTQTPVVRFENEQAVFNASTSAHLYITKAGTTDKQTVASITLDFTGKLQISISNQTAFARMSVASLEVHVDQDDNKHWEDQIRDFVRDLVEQSVNYYLLRGLPLHLPFGAQLDNPEVKFCPNTLLVQSAFSYHHPVHVGPPSASASVEVN